MLPVSASATPDHQFPAKEAGSRLLHAVGICGCTRFLGHLSKLQDPVLNINAHYA